MDDFIQRMKDQQEMIQRLLEGPARYIRENEAAIARVRELVRGIDTSTLDAAFASVHAAGFAERLTALAEASQTAVARLATPEVVTAMDRYVREQAALRETVERIALSHKAWTGQIASMSLYIDASQFTLATIDLERIGALIAATDAQRGALATLTDHLLVCHTAFVNSLTPPDGSLTAFPPAIVELPTLDVFVHTTAVRSITPHEPLEDDDELRAGPLRLTIVNETVTYLEETLPALKPAFLVQYRGMRERAADRSPDSWTQGSASMRKLLKGVLHTAAPNDVVLPWAKENNKELDRHGRPTRATKVEWLCQFIPNDAYRAFVRTELKSALTLIELVDTAQHVDEFPEFEDQFDWIMLRAEVAIRHMLALWKSISYNTVRTARASCQDDSSQ